MFQGTDPRILWGPQSRSWSRPLLYFSHDESRLYNVSTAPAAPASTPGLRAQQLRAPGCRGRGGFGLCVQQGRWAINTRGRRRWERAIRAGGDRPRSEPSKVAWGGGEGGAGRVGGERAQGRHGRLDARPSAAGAESSGAKRAVAASPPRAQPSSRSPAPARDPPPPRPASGK